MTRRGRPGGKISAFSAVATALGTLALAAFGLMKLLGPALPGSAGESVPPFSSPLPSPLPTETLPPIYLERADVDADVGRGVLLELLKLEERPSGQPDLSGSAPRLLIYHTHATEAYFPTDDSPYVETSAWRTDEAKKNVTAVGERLALILGEQYGISVLHDVTNHEPPKLSSAYGRSEVTMLKYKKEYPSLTMYLDLHRDSYGDNPGEVKDFVVIDGKEVARIMFVVGTGEGATGTGFDEMPDFQANYALAKKLTDYLAGIHPGLVRNIRVKTSRYNQHVGDNCVLVEAGHNANTLEQAFNAMDYLAEAIAAVSAHDVETLRRIVLAMGKITGPIDSTALTCDIDDFLTRYEAMQLGDLDLGVFMKELLDLA